MRVAFIFIETFTHNKYKKIRSQIKTHQDIQKEIWKQSSRFFFCLFACFVF